MSLTGETVKRPNGERVAMYVDIATRTRLSEFLYLPAMRGVGYSEFIERALDAAEAELVAESETATD